MRNAVLVVIVLGACAVLAAGCGPQAATRGMTPPTFAWWLPHETVVGLGHYTIPPEPPAGAAPGRVVVVEVKFLAVPSERLIEILPLAPDKIFLTLTAAQTADVLKAIQACPGVQVLSAPRIALMAGRQGTVMLAGEKPFVADVAFKVAGDGKTGTWEPVRGKVREGVSMAVSVQDKGGPLELTVHALETASLLGLRECTGSVADGGGLRQVAWQEAVWLSGTGPTPAPAVPLAVDESVVMPVFYQMFQTTGNVRAFAGNVREQLLAPPPRTECVVILTLRSSMDDPVMPPKTGKAK